MNKKLGGGIMATTPLGNPKTGIGVRKFKDYSATQASQALSRAQYHHGLKTNDKVRRDLICSINYGIYLVY